MKLISWNIDSLNAALTSESPRAQLSRNVLETLKNEDADVVAKISTDVMNAIMEGRMTFQRAFMTGEMTAKGNFKTLRMLDQVFHFGE